MTVDEAIAHLESIMDYSTIGHAKECRYQHTQIIWDVEECELCQAFSAAQNAIEEHGRAQCQTT